jgi:hypothetical protein
MNNRSKRQGQQSQHASNREKKDKKVPMKHQIQNSKETDTDELTYFNIDGPVDKTKFHMRISSCTTPRRTDGTKQTGRSQSKSQDQPTKHFFNFGRNPL